MVVTGDKEGRVKFFDSELKLLNWYDDTMRYGPLCSISFSFSPNIALLKSSLGAGKRSAGKYNIVCVLRSELVLFIQW